MGPTNQAPYPPAPTLTVVVVGFPGPVLLIGVVPVKYPPAPPAPPTSLLEPPPPPAIIKYSKVSLNDPGATKVPEYSKE